MSLACERDVVWQSEADLYRLFRLTKAFAPQRMTLQSNPPEARRLPSGLNATDMTQSLWAVSVVTCFPLLESQTLTVPSLLPEATSLPCEWKATDMTQSLCPVKVVVLLRVRTSQIRTVSSSPPEARVPSAPNDRAKTAPLWPRKVAACFLDFTSQTWI